MRCEFHQNEKLIFFLFMNSGRDCSHRVRIRRAIKPYAVKLKNRIKSPRYMNCIEAYVQAYKRHFL